MGSYYILHIYEQSVQQISSFNVSVIQIVIIDYLSIIKENSNQFGSEFKFLRIIVTRVP